MNIQQSGLSPSVTEANVYIKVSVKGKQVFSKTLRLSTANANRGFLREKTSSWLKSSYSSLNLDKYFCQIQFDDGESFLDGDTVDGSKQLLVDYFEKDMLDAPTSGLDVSSTPDRSILENHPSEMSIPVQSPTPPQQSLSAIQPLTSTPTEPDEPDYSDVPDKYRMYCFKRSQVYDVDSIIQTTEASTRRVILTNLSDPITLKMKKEGRRNLLRVAAKWLLSHCSEFGLPTKSEKALMAFSIVARFPCLQDKDSAFGWEYIFDPCSCEGFFGKAIQNQRANHKQLYPQIRKRKRKLDTDLSAAHDALVPDDLEGVRLQLKSLRPTTAQTRNQITSLTKSTSQYRADWIKSKSPTIREVLQRWPRFKDMPSLLITDAQFWWKEKDSSYKHTPLKDVYLPLVLAILHDAVTVSHSESKHNNSPNTVGLLNVLQGFGVSDLASIDNLDRDEQVFLSLLCLPYIMCLKTKGPAEQFFNEIFKFKMLSSDRQVSEDIAEVHNRTQPYLLVYTSDGTLSGTVKEIFIVCDKVELQTVGSVDVLASIEILHALFWSLNLRYPKAASPLFQFIGKVKGQNWGVVSSVTEFYVNWSQFDNGGAGTKLMGPVGNIGQLEESEDERDDDMDSADCLARFHMEQLDAKENYLDDNLEISGDEDS